MQNFKIEKMGAKIYGVYNQTSAELVIYNKNFI